MKGDLNSLFDSFDNIFETKDRDLVNENANTDGKSPVGMQSLVASESSKAYAEKFLDKNVLKAYQDGFIHIHDFDFYMTGTTTCCQIDLGKLLSNGFQVGECFIRPPKSIGTAMCLASIIIQSNQNMQHGGQSFPNFDFDLAPYVKLTYENHVKELTDDLISLVDNVELLEDNIKEKAWEKTIEDTFQACEGFIHNSNSMLCRNGSQVPFMSVNFGLDTSKEGRLVSEQLMLAQQKGLGDGATPIFPILVFKLKKGVSAEKGDPNYDLYELALETTSKRLFPKH